MELIRDSTRIRSHRFIGLRFFVVAALALLMMMTTNIEAWSFRDVPIQHSKSRTAETTAHGRTRRDFVAITSALIVAAPPLSDVTRANAAEDIDAKEQFIAARKDLHELIANYSDITAKGGGDAVRNRLGTQGVNSKLFGIQKVLKTLKADAEDIVEYTETMDEFNAYYYQAEGAAYQSMFIAHSSAKGTPESILKTAKNDIVQMEKYMDQLAVQLKL